MNEYSESKVEKWTLKETINYAMKQCVFHKKERDLYEEIVIGLYLRIDTCVRHQPKDLEEYLVAWRYWVTEIEPTLGEIVK